MNWKHFLRAITYPLPIIVLSLTCFFAKELKAWAATLADKQYASFVVDGTLLTADPIASKYLYLLAGKGSDNKYHVIATDASGNIGFAGFPAASALADADPNPTTTRIGANLLGWNGATWDRVPVDSNKFLKVTLGTVIDPVNDGIALYAKKTTHGDTALLTDTNSFLKVTLATAISAATDSITAQVTDGSVLTGYGQEGTNIEITGSSVKYCTASNALSVGSYYEIQTDGRTHCTMVADNSGSVATTDEPYDSPGIYHRYVIDTSHDTICCITTGSTVIVDATLMTLVAQ